MRLLVCGGRNYTDRDCVWRTLQPFVFQVLICGMARGADRLALDYAKAHKIRVEEYYPDYLRHGRRAPLIRNLRMLRQGQPDLVIAFPGGNGTAHMVGISREARVEVLEISV